MGEIKKENIKNWTYYFYNDRTDLKSFDAKLSTIDKKNYKDIDIYYIGYVTVKKNDDCNSINSPNPLYLMLDEWLVTLKKRIKIST